METILKRHGFVTFWLWFMIVGNIILAIPYISDMIKYKDILEGVNVIFNIINIIAIMLIMKWRKIGFFIFLLLCIRTLIFIIMHQSYFISSGALMLSVASCIISPLTLFIILQIRKNGVSCWDQLK